MCCKKQDLYIEVLTFGKDNTGKPITYPQLQQYLKKQGYDYDEFALRQFFHELFICSERPGGNNSEFKPSDTEKFYLESSGYFHLLEHTELQEARRSSLVATYIAIAAIALSILTSIATTVISIMFTQS